MRSPPRGPIGASKQLKRSQFYIFLFFSVIHPYIFVFTLYTMLQTSLHSVEFQTAYVILFTVTMYLYSRLVKSNPGYIDQRLIDDLIRRNGPSSVYRKCEVCCLEVPYRCRHCYECGRCVALMDHHCPWIQSCVGEYNVARFFWFLVLECVLVAVTLWITVDAHSWKAIWESWNLVFILCVLIFALLFSFSMVCSNLWLLWTGQTTLEMVKWRSLAYMEQKRQFDRGVKENCGLVLNFARVFGSQSFPPLVAWIEHKKKATNRDVESLTDAAPSDHAQSRSCPAWVHTVTDNKYYSCF
eukprot:ANDGO_06276.mRNA.1 Protein S-acyltransferase 8